jgi:hypothetical protein
MTMKTTKNAFVAQLASYIAGIGKHYAGQTLLLDGQNVTAASLVTLFQAVTNASAASDEADTQRTAAIAKTAAAIAAAQPMATAFKAMVLTASGKDTATLADFDLTPRKVPVISPETRVAAAKKAAATRKALGTMGSQQKKDARKALAAQGTPAVEATPATPATVPVAPVAPKV